MWYEMKQPGRYTWTVSLPPAGVSHTFEVAVRLGDERELEASCEELMARYKNSPVYGERKSAAVALSYVRSDIAVPFLRQIMLGSGEFEVTGAEGLGRVGTIPAARALIEGLHAPRNDVLRAVARRELLGLEEKGDPAVRALISASLAQ
jgi:hypothetical protein